MVQLDSLVDTPADIYSDQTKNNMSMTNVNSVTRYTYPILINLLRRENTGTRRSYFLHCVAESFLLQSLVSLAFTRIVLHRFLRAVPLHRMCTHGLFLIHFASILSDRLAAARVISPIVCSRATFGPLPCPFH